VMSRRSLIQQNRDSFRKNSYRAVSVGLQLQKLESLLCDVAQQYCEDQDFIRYIENQFRGLAARKGKLGRGELVEIIDTLKAILNLSPSLPPRLVAYIHSTIGLVRQLQGENERAIGSLMKALWLETASYEPDAELVGLAVHRLGIIYGRNGNYEEARVMLEKAGMIYKSAGLRDDHPFMTNVIEELEALALKHERALSQSESLRGIRTPHSMSISRRISF